MSKKPSARTNESRITAMIERSEGQRGVELGRSKESLLLIPFDMLKVECVGRDGLECCCYTVLRWPRPGGVRG